MLKTMIDLNASAIFILMVVIVGLFAFLFNLKTESDLEFQNWFDEVITLASKQGYTQEQIDELEEIDFYVFYMDDCTAEEALQKSKF